MIDPEGTLDYYEKDIWFQGDYIKDLLEVIDYPTFDVEAMNQTFMEWEHHKHVNIMTYRDVGYRSVITNNEQPVHHTPWLEAMDDSMDSYLGSG